MCYLSIGERQRAELIITLSSISSIYLIDEPCSSLNSKYRKVIYDYIERLGKKYCVIMDNAPWHKKAIRLIWTEAYEEYADIREKLEYLSLPPYSPDLNPVEQIWRKNRREKTHNRYFSSLMELIGTLGDYFAQFFMPNDQLRSLCSFSCFV